MDGRFVHRNQQQNAQIQGVGALVSEQNRRDALDLMRRMHKIDTQNAAERARIDKNLESALNCVDQIRNFVNDPSHILGTDNTKHGEIAEQIDIWFHNANRIMHNRRPDAVKSEARTGAEDYFVRGVAVQSKYINGSNNSLVHVLEHMEKYKDINFGRDGSYYVIPRDQYEQIKNILSGDTGSLSNKSVRAILDKVCQIEQETGRSFLDVVRPGHVDYAAVQRGKVMETLDYKDTQLNDIADRQKRRADDRSEVQRKEAQQAAAPSLQKAASVAAGAAAFSGTSQFAIGIYRKCKEGKKINEFTTEDWQNIGVDTAKAAVEGGISGFAIYGITNLTNIETVPAASGVTLAISLSELAYRRGNGIISQEEFEERCQIAALNAAVSAVGAIAGQHLIPIPILGAYIGSFIATEGLEMLCDEGFHNALTMSAYEVQQMARKLAYETSHIASNSAHTAYSIAQAGSLHAETQTILDDFNRKKR